VTRIDPAAVPELAAILRTGHRSRFRLSELVCERGGDRFAEVFRSPAGPILVGRGLATEEADRQRGGYIVRYLARESVGAAVSLQCRCSNHPLPVGWLLEQRGRVVLPPRQRAKRPPSH
jgi:hypothetical protein